MKTFSFRLLLCLFAWLSFSLSAAVQFWDPDGVTIGTSVSGNWDTSTTNWTDVPDSGVNAVWVQGNDASFGVTSDFTVTLTEPISVGSMTVTGNAGGLTIAGTSVNNLTLAGAPSTFNIGGSRTVSLSAPVGGSAALTKSGNGTLTLPGANTYSGGTTLSAGTIGLGIDSVSSGGVITSGPLGTGTLTFSAAATVFASGAARVVHNPVTLNGGLTNTGSQTLTFTNGNILVNGGNRNITVLNTADLIIGGALIHDATARTLTKAGAGRLILAGNNTNYQGQITVSVGTLLPGTPTGCLTSNTISVSAGAALDLNGQDARLYKLAGAGSVLLGTNTITVGNDFTSSELTGVMSGTGGYIKVGSVSQVLSGTNTFSGGITIKAGSLYLPTNGVSGSPTALGAGTNTITIVESGRIGQNKIGLSILTNHIVLANVGASSELDPAGAGTVQFVLAGPISGSGGLMRSTKGSGVVALTGDNTFAGGVQMDARLLVLGHKNALGTGAFTIGNPTNPPGNTIELAGYVSDLAGPNAIGNTTTINQNFTFNGTATGFGVELSGPVTLSSGTKTITATGSGVAKISGVISGSGGVIKAGANTLVLAGNNTYTGSTIVAEATLALTNSGSVAGSSDVTLVAGTILDASGRTDGTLTVGAAQTLKGDGTFYVVGSLTNNGVIELKVNKSGSVFPDSIQGLNQIRYGGTLNLVLSGDPLAAGDALKLFDATNGYSGSFATIVPATPGTGLAWDTASLTINGTLNVVAAPASPQIGSAVVSGADFIISGSGGTAGSNYVVLCSTNVALARSNWTVVATNQFDGSGNFSLTNAYSPTDPQRFYLIQVP